MLYHFAVEKRLPQSSYGPVSEGPGKLCQRLFANSTTDVKTAGGRQVLCEQGGEVNGLRMILAEVTAFRVIVIVLHGSAHTI